MAWRQLAGINQTSSSYLYNLAHKNIEEQYNQQEAEKEKEQAIELTQYLRELKQYAQGLLNTSNYFQQEELELFKQELQKVGGRNNRSLQKLFGVSDTGKKRQHRFEQDIRAVLQATQNIVIQKGINLGPSLQNIPINLGQSTTNVSINQELYANSIKDNITNIVMKNFEVQSKKFYQTIGKTGRGLTSVSVKADTSGTYLKVTQEAEYNINKIVPSFERFASLMLSASFSLKNYNSNRKGINIDKQQMLRGILDLLPQLSNGELTGDALVAFTYALTNRMTGKAKEKDINDNNINQSLGRIDYIYRISGRGQNYDTDNIQLNNFLKQGVKFLIYNEWNGNNIWVISVKDIIYQKLNTKNSSALNNFGESITISKKLFDY